MSMREKLLLVVLLWLISCSTQGQSLNEFECALKESYIKGNLEDWPQRIQNMEKQSDGSFGWQFEILEARYGLVGCYLGKGERKKAREYLDDSQDYLDSMMVLYPNSAKLYSVKTGFYGFHIALSMFRAPVLLPKIKRSLKRAFELDPNEPRAWLEKGNLAYNRPVAFGGDKLDAIRSYHKTLELLKQEKNSSCDWMTVMVQVFLIKAYYQTNQKHAYQMARLELQKTYGKMSWVSDFMKASIVD